MLPLGHEGLSDEVLCLEEGVKDALEELLLLLILPVKLLFGTFIRAHNCSTINISSMTGR